MYARLVRRHHAGARLIAVLLTVGTGPLAAQTRPQAPAPEQHEHQAAPVSEAEQQGDHVHDMSHEPHVEATRESSGTAWQPDYGRLGRRHGRL